ncbi:MAG: protein kinase [Planctomycetota bacterium]|nr:protein kinase [Planctomycetota bacterium]
MNQKGANDNTAGASGILPAGSKLGKYEIVERLGSGGQSIVYKGHDPLLDRYVAIKQVAPQLASDEKFTRRFREVARQLARLGCEEVVTLYELMEENDGLFVVMEFVEGHTIETTLTDHPEPIDPTAVLHIIWRIASGLTEIHQAGIVHRDIKPGNIIIGEKLKVTITDFGVAAKAGAAVSMKLGTTKYMAPELFAGGEVDGRADIYSLGMIAYEMLLGRLKFNEVFHDIVRDPHSEALRWMKWHSSPEQVAPPLSGINPDIPQALSVTVAKMLAKNPDERFTNIEELGREIRANFSSRTRRPVSRKHLRKKRRIAGAAPEGREQIERSRPVEDAESEPITAEIPKEPMPLRKKLAIAGAIAGVIIVGLLVYGVIDRSQQNKIRKEAQNHYDRAESLYKEASKADTSRAAKAKYADAMEVFKTVRNNKQYARQVVARQAEVMEYFCRARLAALEEDWPAAYAQFESTDKLTKQLQRSRGELYKWTQERERELREFDSWLTSRRHYVIEMNRAKKAVAEGKLDDADRILLEKAGPLALSDEQVAEIQTLRRDIKEKQKQGEYWRYIRRGDELAGSGNVDGAIGAWDQALAVLESARSAMSSNMYEDLKETAEKKKTSLITETNYAAAISEAEKAKKAGNLLVAAAAYEKADKIKPDKTVLAKARDLRHDHHLRLGRQHLTANRLKEAEQELKKAKSYKASPEIETELKKIVQIKNSRLLLDQGDGLFRQKKYEAALEKYEAAEKLSADAELRGKITDCRYYIELNAADVYRVKAEWSKAEAAYNKARQIKPAVSAEVDARLALLRQDRIYAEQFGAAEKALKARDLNEALARAEEAKLVRATPEVEQLIKRIRYEQQVALGTEAMNREDYNGASAYFRQAKRFLATPEIDKLIEQADKLKEAAASGSG